MKLSIIFGVVHMVFGVTMSVVNHVHFNNKMNIILEFLPQVIFLVLLFFYMVALMFMKWIMYSCEYPEHDIRYSPGCAPSVLIMFINMMLFKSSEPPQGCDEFMFEGQGTMQQTFVFIALLCIPVMLLGKPLYILTKKSAQLAHRAMSNGDINQGMELQPEVIDPPKPSSSHAEHEEESMTEIWIHQAIHTIEYVLSTVSHTASYLRLWALSLAHGQLSEVLWNMILKMGLSGETLTDCIMLYIVFAFWAMLTLAILVMMEGLSAFLHTLRLHWVEFMSKFYTGLGYPFQPFCFKMILEEETVVDE